MHVFRILLPWRSGHISSHDRHVAYYLLQESKKNKGWSNRQWPGVQNMLHKKNCYMIQRWSEGRQENTDMILYKTELFGSSSNAYQWYSGGALFESQPGLWSSWGFSWIYSVSPWKCADSTSNKDTTGFKIPSSSWSATIPACTITV